MGKSVGYEVGLGWIETYELLKFPSGEVALIHAPCGDPPELRVLLLGKDVTGDDVLSALFDAIAPCFEGDLSEFRHGDYGDTVIEEGHEYPIGERPFLVRLFGLEGVLGIEPEGGWGTPPAEGKG